MTGCGGANYFILKAKPDTDATEGKLVFQIENCFDVFAKNRNLRDELTGEEGPSYTKVEIPVRIE